MSAAPSTYTELGAIVAEVTTGEPVPANRIVKNRGKPPTVSLLDSAIETADKAKKRASWWWGMGYDKRKFRNEGSPAEAIAWVAEHMLARGVSRAQAPSALAWAVLQLCRRDEVRAWAFYSQIWAKSLLKVSVDEEARASEKGQVEEQAVQETADLEELLGRIGGQADEDHEA